MIDSILSGNFLNILYLIFSIVLVIFAALYAHENAKKDFAKALESLNKRGYVHSYWVEPKRGHLTCIWAQFEKPIPYYLHISNRDIIQVLAGQMGIKDMKLGDEEFDKHFFVRTNNQELTKSLITIELQKQFLTFEEITFLTGSIDSLLNADYWPEQKEDRDLRKFWMVRTAGRISEEEGVKYLEFGKLLAGRITEACNQFGECPREELLTKTFEGR